MASRHFEKIVGILNEATISGDTAKAKRQLLAYRLALENEARSLDESAWGARREILLALDKIENAKKIL